LLTAASLGSAGQSTPYKFDIGAGLGMSGYIGEANRSSLMKHPGFVGELSFRYLPDVRWAFRGTLSLLTLSGSTADMDDVLPSTGPESYDFKSTVYDLGGRVEFNFFSYGIGETYKRLRRWSPYLTLGVGVSLSSSGGETSVAPSLPMGLGVKFKVSPRVNLAAEFTMTKVFGDKVDGPLLNDLNMIKTAFYKNTDWYSRLTIGISYEFGRRCETCHYVD
jgi:hypothetical protein